MSLRRGCRASAASEAHASTESEIMISSLERDVARVGAGRDRYFMKNGVNRCGTQYGEEEGSGKKKKGRARVSSTVDDVFLSPV